VQGFRVWGSKLDWNSLDEKCFAKIADGCRVSNVRACSRAVNKTVI